MFQKTPLSKLEHYDVRGSALTLIRTFLKRQKFVMLKGKFSKTLRNDFSVLQVLILGPLLFLTYINKIYTLKQVQNSPRLLADDTCLSISHNSLFFFQDNFNTELKSSAIGAQQIL